MFEDEDDDEYDRPTAEFEDLTREPGLVRNYAYFIWRRTRRIANLYPWLPFDEFLFEAHRVSRIAADRFREKLGNDFSTYCGHYLKGLHRFAKKHPDFKRRSEYPSAVDRSDPKIKKMLLLNRADPGFVRTILDYQQLDGEEPRNNDVGVLHHVANRRANRFGSVVMDAAQDDLSCNSYNEAAVLDWMVGRLSGTDSRNATELAEDTGLTKGAVSKIQTRILDQLELWCDRKSRRDR